MTTWPRSSSNTREDGLHRAFLRLLLAGLDASACPRPDSRSLPKQVRSFLPRPGGRKLNELAGAFFFFPAAASCRRNLKSSPTRASMRRRTIMRTSITTLWKAILPATTWPPSADHSGQGQGAATSPRFRPARPSSVPGRAIRPIPTTTGSKTGRHLRFSVRSAPALAAIKADPGKFPSFYFLDYMIPKYVVCGEDEAGNPDL